MSARVHTQSGPWASRRRREDSGRRLAPPPLGPSRGAPHPGRHPPGPGPAAALSAGPSGRSPPPGAAASSAAGRRRPSARAATAGRRNARRFTHAGRSRTGGPASRDAEDARLPRSSRPPGSGRCGRRVDSWTSGSGSACRDRLRPGGSLPSSCAQGGAPEEQPGQAPGHNERSLLPPTGRGGRTRQQTDQGSACTRLGCVGGGPRRRLRVSTAGRPVARRPHSQPRTGPRPRRGSERLPCERLSGRTDRAWDRHVD